MNIPDRRYPPAFPNSERFGAAMAPTPTLLPLPSETPEPVDRDYLGILPLGVAQRHSPRPRAYTRLFYWTPALAVPGIVARFSFSGSGGQNGARLRQGPLLASEQRRSGQPSRAVERKPGGRAVTHEVR